jgi:hypothetical protein
VRVLVREGVGAHRDGARRLVGLQKLKRLRG